MVSPIFVRHGGRALHKNGHGAQLSRHHAWVLEHLDVAPVSFGVDLAVLDGCLDRTFHLVRVGTVRELAVAQPVDEFDEVGLELFSGDDREVERPYARRVDHVAADVQPDQAGGRGRMPTFVRALHDVFGLEVQTRLNGVEKRAFAHAALTGYDTCLVLEHGGECVDADSRHRACGNRGIAKRAIAFEQSRSDAIGVQVDLVDADDGCDVAHERGDDVAVDQVRFERGFLHRGDDDRLINVGDDCLDSPTGATAELPGSGFHGLDDTFVGGLSAGALDPKPHVVADGYGMPFLDQLCAQDSPHGARSDALTVIHVGVQSVHGYDGPTRQAFPGSLLVVRDDHRSMAGKIAFGDDALGVLRLGAGILSLVGLRCPVGDARRFRAIPSKRDADLLGTLGFSFAR